MGSSGPNKGGIDGFVILLGQGQPLLIAWVLSGVISNCL